MIFKLGELFFKLSLLSKCSTEIERVFNGTGVICSKCYFATFDFFSFGKKLVSLHQKSQSLFSAIRCGGRRTDTLVSSEHLSWDTRGNTDKHSNTQKCLNFAVFKNYISINKGEGRIQGKQEIQLCLKLRGKLYICIQLDSSQVSLQ